METSHYIKHASNKGMLRRIFCSIRRNIFTLLVRCKAAQVGVGCCVNHYSKVTKKTYLGEHVNFNGIKMVGGGKIEIGRFFHSGTDCLIMTSSHNYEGEEIPYDDMDIVKDVRIEDFVWIGNHVMILPGVTIGEGAIIQAGSVVVNDIPSCTIAGGNLARVFKHRDKVHFDKLKSEMKFH